MCVCVCVFVFFFFAPFSHIRDDGDGGIHADVSRSP